MQRFCPCAAPDTGSLLLLLPGGPGNHKSDAEASLGKLEQALTEFQALIDAKDKQLVPIKQRECLTYVGEIEEAMVKGFPFEVPQDYANRPLLKVRGSVLWPATIGSAGHCAIHCVASLRGMSAPSTWQGGSIHQVLCCQWRYRVT